MAMTGPGVPEAALFDLDGTLIDSVPDIALAVGELLTSEGLAAPQEAEVRNMVGRGVGVLIERAFASAGRALSTDEHATLLARMMTIYPRHLIGRTTLLPGTTEALGFLRRSGAKVALVTNKPQAFTDTILRHFGILSDFDLILGDDPLSATHNLPRKPAPDMLLYALRELGVAPARAIMVGDSEADIRSGKAAGVYTVAVRGGYSAAPIESFSPDLLLDSLADLPAALSRPAARSA